MSVCAVGFAGVVLFSIVVALACVTTAVALVSSAASYFSGLTGAPEAVFLPAPADGVAPEGYHAMSIFPEYFHIGGQWHLAEESRMDCVAVWEEGRIAVREFRRLRRGDLVAVGRTEHGEEGILVHPDGFHIVWVMGPAFAFDHDARTAFSRLVEGGYVHAVLAGNALATHDLEAAYLGTALGQDIYTQESRPLGHYNHLDTINAVRRYGSIPAFLKGEGIHGGILWACEKMGVPYVLAGSIRDDGPLPPVIGNVYDAQDAMRDQVRSATTVICMATTLHTIATGNMTPSYRVLPDNTVRQVYFYCVDISEFTVNKLSDRGSLSARGIVTNAQDFIVNLSKGLELM